jgi:membrane associated rhomboid family serine protease
VNDAALETTDAPIWARREAFPPAPPGWGWVDSKNQQHPCDSLETLAAAIREDTQSKVCLVWTPSRPQMVVPEESGELIEAIRAARTRWSHDDLDDAQHKMRWLGLMVTAMVLYTFYRATGLPALAGETFPEKILPALRATIGSLQIGIALLVFTIFAFIPWYQARKRAAELNNWSETTMAASVPLIRFEIWLERQNAPVTRFFLGLMILVGIAQLLPSDGISAAGLVKSAYRSGESWRLLTAPFLHGNIVHFLMNAAALLYLGKRLEVFARWPHLPLVFLFSAWIGGEASARWVHAPSVGASGGLMGWLGFLLVFETLHARLVPRSARRRLAAGVLLTALIGLLGYRFIDNAAHAGGLIAGMAYALIVFPKSASAYRPKSTTGDRILGSIALAICTAAALFAVWKITAP